MNYGIKLATIDDRLASPLRMKAAVYDPVEVI